MAKVERQEHRNKILYAQSLLNKFRDEIHQLKLQDIVTRRDEQLIERSLSVTDLILDQIKEA